MAFTLGATWARLRLTLQLVLVLDVHLPAEKRVPQTQWPVKHVRASGRAKRKAVHVECLHCVQPGPCSCLVILSFASWEVDGIFGDVEARHDCAGTAVHNWVAKDWLNLLVRQQHRPASAQADSTASTQCYMACWVAVGSAVCDNW